MKFQTIEFENPENKLVEGCNFTVADDGRMEGWNARVADMENRYTIHLFIVTFIQTI